MRATLVRLTANAIRSLAPVVLLAGLSAPSVGAGAEADLRCTAADIALAGKLRGAIDRQDSAERPLINQLMAHQTSARLDCKHGRAERGLATYRRIDEHLGALERRRADASGAAQ